MTLSVVQQGGVVALAYDSTTKERGTLIKMVNRTGAASVKGLLVSCSTSTDREVIAQSNASDTIGVIQEAGVAEGSEMWVWVAGSICQVLMKNNTAAVRGYILIAANADGRADNVDSLNNSLSIKCGHIIESESAGTNVLALAILHLNGFNQSQSQTQGNIYYVDATGGDDNNDGLSSVNAWQTITKINGATFVAGDSVLFKRGETWSGTNLTIPSSGAAGNVITFGTYGSGARPVITGANTATQSILIDGNNYLTLDGLDIAGSASSNFALDITGGHDILISNCVVRDAAVWFGIRVQGAGTSLYNITISNCTVHDNYASGIVIENYPTYASGPENVLIENNTCYSNGTSTSADHGIYLNAVESTVKGNICYDNAGSGIKCQSCVDCLFEQNLCYGSTPGAGLQNYGIFTGVEASPATNSGNTFKNNILRDNVYGIYSNVLTAANYYYHNTLVNNGKGNGTGYGVFFAGNGMTNQVFKNNLILQDQAVIGTYNCCWHIGTATDIPNNTFDYNDVLYLNDVNRLAEVTSTRYAFSGWQALTGSPDANSINADPIFKVDYSNLHLDTGSPCIAAGDAAVGVTTDYDSVARGAAVDIGAYEYV